jgi:hypothetical protein
MPFEMVKRTETSDCQSDGQLVHDKIFEEFCADRETIAALGVTDIELQELSRASLLGTLSCKEDVLFLLHQIREALKPAEPRSNGPSLPNLNLMTETMRRAALVKLNELDSKAAKRRESALGRIEAACTPLITMLHRAKSLVAQVSHRLDRRSAGSRPA